MTKKIICFIFIVAFLVGCEKEPMQKLASDKEDKTMTKGFWQQEYVNKTNLWNDGYSYCQKYQGFFSNSKPNCIPLMKVATDGIIDNAMKKALPNVNSEKLDLPWAHVQNK